MFRTLCWKQQQNFIVGPALLLLGSISHLKCESNLVAVERKDQLNSRLAAINAELLSKEDAQKLKVHRVPKFLSDSEIQIILDFQREHRNSLGTTRRDKNGVRALDSPWVTTYLSTDHLLQRTHPALVHKLVAAALEADEAEQWHILDDRTGITARVMELHDVEPGGALSDEHHFDGGSLVTLDVMLSHARDFQGGAFCTPEADGSTARHVFERGDLVVFPSHKRHFVQPVSCGHRRVLVVELWRGDARGCAHRCEQHVGDCAFSRLDSALDTLLHASFPDVDPW